MPDSPPQFYKVQFREGSYGAFRDANEWSSWDHCIEVICNIFKESVGREVRLIDQNGTILAATNQRTGADLETGDPT